MSYFFVAGLNLGLVAMLTGGLECAWALHFMHNFFIGIIVGGPAALYRPVAAHRGARPGRNGRRHRHRAGDGGDVRPGLRRVRRGREHVGAAPTSGLGVRGRGRFREDFDSRCG